MTAREAVKLCTLLDRALILPVHYEGWSHFRQGRSAVEMELARSNVDVRRRVHWLPMGDAVDVAYVRAERCAHY
jgi:hypothetical protein